MITSKEELSSAIVSVFDDVTKVCPIDITIRFKGETFNYYRLLDEVYSTESVIRALMLLVAQGKLAAEDISITEKYANEEDEVSTHDIEIQTDGSLSEKFISHIMCINDNLYSELNDLG